MPLSTVIGNFTIEWQNFYISLDKMFTHGFNVGDIASPNHNKHNINNDDNDKTEFFILPDET